jgi:hypothetical protein
MYPKLRKILLIIFLLTFAVSYFFKNNYKTVDNIHPEVLQEPLQATINGDSELITFSKDGYSYSLMPEAEYKIQAMVVHRMDYRFFSIYSSDSVFPVDLCLTWGDNLKNKGYQNKTLSFSQDARFCFYRWRGEANVISPNLVSNNHLIANDPKILSVINKIKTGDQVSISGYLVNVEANKVGEVSNYSPNSFSLKSSLTRTDDGAGACEIIYIKDIKIIRVGHPVWSFLFELSFYSLIILIVLSIVNIITYQHVYKPRRKTD